MEATLKKICNQNKQRGNLFQKDWDALPLPSLPREGKPPYLFNMLYRTVIYNQ